MTTHIFRTLTLAAIVLFGFGCTPSSSLQTPRDATYTIENSPVTLVNGLSETVIAPGDASKVVTRYFGNEAVGDLNGDGKPDTALLLTQSSGGSGTFYYIAVALRTDQGYQGTNAVFVGDRIAPQTTEIHGKTVVVNYADRKPGEPYSTQPSVGVSKTFIISNGKLVAITVLP